MKVLLTGGSGQVGKEIIKSKPEEIEIINPCRKKLDLSDYNACKKIVEDHLGGLFLFPGQKMKGCTHLGAEAKIILPVISPEKLKIDTKFASLGAQTK